MNVDLMLYKAIKDSEINLILSLPCIMLKGLLQVIEEKKEIVNLENNILEHIYHYPWLVVHSYSLDDILKTTLSRYYNDKKNIESLENELKKLEKQKSNLYLHDLLTLPKSFW